MIKFKGQGIVWDAEKNCILCKFKDEEFETEDTRTAEILKNAGYEFEGEIVKKPTEPTNKQLMAILDEKGVEYDKKATKAELLELVKKLDEEPENDSL